MSKFFIINTEAISEFLPVGISVSLSTTGVDLSSIENDDVLIGYNNRTQQFHCHYQAIKDDSGVKLVKQLDKKHSINIKDISNFPSTTLSSILSPMSICIINEALGVKLLKILYSENNYDCTKTFQQVIFGAPGTGKSYSINKTIGENVTVKVDSSDSKVPLPQVGGDKYIIPDKMVFRTTFHPEYDYAQFVGCYKPIVADEDGKDVTYQFVPQVFTDAYVEAWNNPNKPVFLVIEEINRGNCAQIFGDIFQLLDRNKDGESEYSIQPDKDLQKYLSKKLEINDSNVDESIRNGEALLLPKNFNILATMNTSDQSLYPMDSAFKRRWDWKYTPTITDDKYGKSKNFKIYLGDNAKSDCCNWIDFIKAVNQRIKDATKSEDKQLGEYFIKHDVYIDEFISKVMFYLWTDVCKENYSTKDNFFRTAKDKNDRDKNEEFTFNELVSEIKKDGSTTITILKAERLQQFMNYLDVKIEKITPEP